MFLEFAFTQSTIDEIKAYLTFTSGEIEGRTPVGTGGQSFGAAPASVGCAGDATKAQHKVKAAIADMSIGLQGYVDALQQMEDKAYAVEDVTETEIKKHITLVEACQTVDIKSGGVCSADGN